MQRLEKLTPEMIADLKRHFAGEPVLGQYPANIFFDNQQAQDADQQAQADPHYYATDGQDFPQHSLRPGMSWLVLVVWLSLLGGCVAFFWTLLAYILPWVGRCAFQMVGC